jgi:hypothetical protein
MKMGCVQTSIQSPWQNGVAERWVGSCRRELLDQIIPLNERHLKRLLLEFISYYHDDRTHLGLHKQTPESRAHSVGRGPVISRRRLGGLHHRYDRTGLSRCWKSPFPQPQDRSVIHSVNTRNASATQMPDTAQPATILSVELS